MRFFAKQKASQSVNNGDGGEKLSQVVDTDNIAERLRESRNIFESYFDAMSAHETAVVCTVKMTEQHELAEGFEPLVVKPCKESISYRYENGAWGYRDATHALTMNGREFRLACSSSGDVDLYEIIDGVGKGYGSCEAFGRVADPMYAFCFSDNVYIVFNLPTDDLIVRGTRARVPKLADGIASTSGTVAIVRFDGKESSVLEPSITAADGYHLALIADKSGMPVLICANIRHDGYTSEYPDNFLDLFDAVFDDEEELFSRALLPLGVSAKRFSDDAQWTQIPINGDERYGIASVSFAASPDGEGKMKLSVEGEEEEASPEEEPLDAEVLAEKETEAENAESPNPIGAELKEESE